MTNTSLENQIRAEAILSINKNIIKTILDELTTHGADPHNNVMIVAALSMCINDLDKAFPGTKMCLMEMLKGK